jgi:crossover junction endonuclease MUS81
MLNAIVERKEVHDLSGSIIDRRYFEQKTRLGVCGLTHVIYLVEGSLTQQQTAVRASGLQTAMCRTQVQNRFFVQLCRSADESVAFLASVHARLLAKFPRHACRNRELPSPARASPFLAPAQQSEPPGASVAALDALLCRPVLSFSAFNAQFRKKSAFTVGELYQMMLLQAPGLSAAKTAALAASFRSFHELRAALAAPGKRGPLDAVRCGDGQRRLGAKTLKALALLLQSPDYAALADPGDQN